MIFLKLGFVDELKFDTHFKSLKISTLFQMTKRTPIFPAWFRWWKHHPQHLFLLAPFS